MNNKQRRQWIEDQKEADRIGAYYDSGQVEGLLGEWDGRVPMPPIVLPPAIPPPCDPGAHV